MARNVPPMKTAKGTELPVLDLRGKDYLEVKWRLVWFREEHADWSIQTEFVVLNTDKQFAVAKATICRPDGHIMATSHKREDQKDFPDYAEKAETGAIGRALALCGYGTQFEPEFEEKERIVDSPIQPRVNKPAQPSPGQPAASQPKETISKPGTVGQAEREHIISLAKEHDWKHEDVAKVMDHKWKKKAVLELLKPEYQELSVILKTKSYSDYATENGLFGGM